MADPPEFDSTALQFADDDEYSTSGDARDGTPTKAEPPLSSIKQGARPFRQDAAQYFNWVLNQFGAIMKALIGALRSRGVKPVTIDFEGSGSFLLPANALPNFDVEGMGGGGGGAGSDGVDFGFLAGGTAGAGGGGAKARSVSVTGVPGTTYPVTLGAGGAGGAGGASGSGGHPGSNGSDGGDSSVGSLAIFRGAQGGTTNGWGGSSTKNGLPAGVFLSNTKGWVPKPGQGGHGFTVSANDVGSDPGWQHGGATDQANGGAAGAFPGSGGNPGGGGGASEWPGNVPGIGGAAADSAAVTVNTAGTAGTLGAGGGGGGSAIGNIGTGPGGSGPNQGAGKDGGPGGLGRIRITYYMPIFDGT